MEVHGGLAGLVGAFTVQYGGKTTERLQAYGALEARGWHSPGGKDSQKTVIKICEEAG